MEKVFIVRKFIRASSINEALKKEKKKEPDECYLENPSDGPDKQKDLVPAIGFNISDYW